MNYTELDDGSLVMLSLSGEEAAYEGLVIRYRKAVLSCARSVTHNLSLAQDAAQDAFVTAWMKLKKLDDPSKYKSWVCRIAENCAKRMMERYRCYVNFDDLAEVFPDFEESANPDIAYARKEESSELYRSLERLPERVKTIIRLFYIEEKPIGEIARYLGVSIGTVKSQLHDGRNRMRKELGAMDEKKTDALIERVREKTKILNDWRFKEDKCGFAEVYRDVLSDAEKLPECEEKDHILAEVLMRGWLWVPEEKTDKVFDRIKETALAGKNEDVMGFAVARESEKFWGDERNRWIREAAIPELEKNGFSTAVGLAWLQIAENLKNDFPGKEKEFTEATEAAAGLLPENTVSGRFCQKVPDLLSVRNKHGDLAENRYCVSLSTLEIKTEKEDPVLCETRTIGFGLLEAYEWRAEDMFHNAAQCGGHFIPNDRKESDDGHNPVCRYLGNETVDTPAGRFEDCRVWGTFNDFIQIITYYKEGTGIVRQDTIVEGYTTTYLLSDCRVTGTGILPLTLGNRWRYTLRNGSSSLRSELVYTVENIENGRAILSGISDTYRDGYNDDSFDDMVSALANDYYATKDGNQVRTDVSHYADRAEILAETPSQKAHAAAAVSVSRRIMASDPNLTPGSKMQNRWNFFTREMICQKNGQILLSSYSSRWSFEWKTWESCYQNQVLLNNFIYRNLFENGHTLWDDKWKDGYTEVLEKTLHSGETVRSEVVCSYCGEVTVPAGTFSNCLKLSIRASGNPEGMDYRDGLQVYTFAPGIGLISAVSDITDLSAKSVYLLTRYEGVGEGYMPLGDGLFRRFDAQNLMDGYEGWTEYRMVKTEMQSLFQDKETYLLYSNQCGVRNSVENVSQYSSVSGEIEEMGFYEENRKKEAIEKGRINDLKILLHFIFRYRQIESGNSAFCSKYLTMICDTIRMLGGGTVPDALLGLYARTVLIAGAAYMHTNQFEKGFSCLDESFAAYRKWETFPKDSLLSFGNDPLFHDIKMVKGKRILVLPDGTREDVDEVETWNLEGGFRGKKTPYYGMTHLNTWAWYKPVCNHPVYGERFSQYVQKAKELAEE